MSRSGVLGDVDEARLRAGNSAKWAGVEPDVLPAWVAEMDFGVPPAVRAALLGAVEAEDFGYPYWPAGDPAVTAFEARMEERYGWVPSPGHTRVVTNLIQALQMVVEHATEPGDAVAVHTPTYPPFLATLERAGRRIVPLEMTRTEAGWRHDDADLAATLAGCRLLVLLNPHNPTGSVLDTDGLDAVARAAVELDLVVFSDEVHAELTYAPARHVPLASRGPEIAERTVTATSASKAYNLAGLRCAVVHVGPPELRSRLDGAPLDYFGDPSGLARLATAAAWGASHAWHAELMRVLEANRRTVATWAAASPYGLEHHAPDATYLAWIDFGRSPVADDPAGRLLRDGRVRLSPGWETSRHTRTRTEHFARLNFATSPALLDAVLDRVDDGLHRAAQRPAARWR